MNSRLTAPVTVLAVLVSLRAYAEPAMILKAQLADLVPELTAGSEFAHAAAIEDDTIAVLSPGSNAVYIFTFNGAAWHRRAELRPAADPNAFEARGRVAVAGDVVFVGVYGWIYVFERPSGGWTDVTETTRLAFLNNNYPPGSLAAHGNVVVAAETFGHRLWLYERPSSGWATASSRAATLVVSATAPGCPASSELALGQVSVFGDTVAVHGTTYECAYYSGPDNFRAFVFEKPATGWGNPASPPTLYQSAFFNLNGPTYSGLALHGDTLLAEDSLYVRPTGGWVNGQAPVAVLSQSDPHPTDLYGRGFVDAGVAPVTMGVALNENMAVVSAPGESGTESAEGAMYVFFRPAGGWTSMTESVKLPNPIPAYGDGFSGVLGLSGSTVIAGSRVDDSGLDADAGQLYVFTRELDSDGVADAADNCPGVANAGQEDADSNGIGDACECPGSAAAAGETAVSAGGGTVPFATNRFLSFHGGSPGQSQAIRITMTSLPGAFGAWNGASAWVGNPVTICETAGIGPGGTCPAGAATFAAATLVCSPVCRSDWDSAGTINLTGRGIVPGATYEVQFVDCGCDYAHPLAYSPSLVLTTSRFGDVAGPFNGSQWTATDGRADVTIDVTSGLAKFANRPGAPSKMRVDSDWPVPDYQINISDVTRLLDGFRGLAFAGSPGAAGPCTGG